MIQQLIHESRVYSYNTEAILGKGAYGVVYKGKQKDGDEVAIKKVEIQEYDDAEVQERYMTIFQREIKNLKKLGDGITESIVSKDDDRKFILLMKDHFEKEEYDKQGVKKRYQFIILEYLDGYEQLSQLLSKQIPNNQIPNHNLQYFYFVFKISKRPHKLLPYEISIKIIFELLRALRYLKSQGICHRDLKPGNIMINVSFDYQVKVIDLGFSRDENELAFTVAGSPIYMAPEILLGDKYDPKLVDIWSIGCIICDILGGESPWGKMTNREDLVKKMRRYITEEIEFKFSPNIPDDMLKILKKILVFDPQKRITIDEIFQEEPFVSFDKKSGKTKVPEPRLSLELQNCLSKSIIKHGLSLNIEYIDNCAEYQVLSDIWNAIPLTIYKNFDFFYTLFNYVKYERPNKQNLFLSQIIKYQMLYYSKLFKLIIDYNSNKLNSFSSIYLVQWKKFAFLLQMFRENLIVKDYETGRLQLEIPCYYPHFFQIQDSDAFFKMTKDSEQMLSSIIQDQLNHTKDWDTYFLFSENFPQAVDIMQGLSIEIREEIKLEQSNPSNSNEINTVIEKVQFTIDTVTSLLEILKGIKDIQGVRTLMQKQIFTQIFKKLKENNII